MKMAETDEKIDIPRLGLVIAYIGVLISYVVIGIIDPLYFSFLLFFGAWLTPFLVVMLAGEFIKKRNPVFWVIAVGLAVVIGLFFGWSYFFWTQDILLAILTTALYGIIIAYLVVRWIGKADGVNPAIWMYVLLLLVIVSCGCLIGGSLLSSMVDVLLGTLLEIIGYVTLSVTVVYILYWLWYVSVERK